MLYNTAAGAVAKLAEAADSNSMSRLPAWMEFFKIRQWLEISPMLGLKWEIQSW
jgi:hypothetical protein